MSPFLPTLFTVALVEIGSANAQFSSALVKDQAAPPLVLRALGLVTAGVMVFAAAGGTTLGHYDPVNARVETLLLGMVLIWAAVVQFRVLKPLAEVEGQNTNVIALRGYTRLALSGSSGLIAFAIGLYSGGSLDAMLGAALGGWVGVMLVNAPVVAMDRHALRRLHVPELRKMAGVLLALVGFYYALTAIRLI